MGSWCSINRLPLPLATLVVGLAVFFYAPSAYATQQQDQKSQLALGVSPAITELVLEPGQPKKFIVTVTNVTDTPLPIKASATSFQLQEEVADKDRAIFDASKWIQAAEPEFILYPRQQKAIGITVTPPTKAEPGGHYATVFFQPLVPTEAVKSNVAPIGSKVGVLALFVVKGAIREAARVSLDVPLFSQHGPAGLRLHIENPGNVHFIPAGSVEIRNIWGGFVDTIPLPPTLILPKTTKTIPIKWDNKRRIGYYSAQAVIKYGTQQTLLTSGSRGFGIFPWLTLMIFFLSIGIVGFVLWYRWGRWRRALSALFGRTGQSKP